MKISESDKKILIIIIIFASIFLAENALEAIDRRIDRQQIEQWSEREEQRREREEQREMERRQEEKERHQLEMKLHQMRMEKLRQQSKPKKK